MARVSLPTDDANQPSEFIFGKSSTAIITSQFGLQLDGNKHAESVKNSVSGLTSDGLGLYFSASSVRDEIPVPQFTIGTGDFTLLLYVYLPVQPLAYSYLIGSNCAQTFCVPIRDTTTTGIFINGAFVNSTFSADAAGFHKIAIRRRAGTVYFDIDGQTSSVANTATINAISKIVLNSYAPSTSYGAKHTSLITFLDTRAWSDEEISSWKINVWSVFEYPEQEIYSTATADGSATATPDNIDLSAATGTASSSSAATGTLDSIDLSAATGTASSSSAATGTLDSIDLSAATGTASSSSVASGSIDSVDLSAPTGTASTSVDATATGSIDSIDLSAPLGTATGQGNATATGAIDAIDLSAPTGTASTANDAAATGSVDSVDLSAATGSASSSSVATGAVDSIDLSAPTGTASVTSDGTATGSVDAIDLTAAEGAASSTNNGVATGSVDSVDLTAPTGTANGTTNGTASGSIDSIDISAPIGSAVGTSDGSAAGAIDEINLTAPVGSASVTVSALTPQDIEAIAAAVWSRSIEGVLTSEMMFRVMLAALAGRCDGVGTSTEHYYAQDGTTPRITATFDAANNRTSIIIDGTP